MFNSFGNILEYKPLFIYSVNDFKITGSIILSNFFEISLNPQLFIMRRLFYLNNSDLCYLDCHILVK